jgi:hypothetical protein
MPDAGGVTAMAYSWFRLYTKIRHDADMAVLSDHQFRIWINLLCLASDAKVRGLVQFGDKPYPLPALARALGTTEQDLNAAIELYEQAGLAQQTEQGLLVVKFLERQYDKPSELPENKRERNARYREARRSRGEVAEKTPESHPISTDTDSDTDTEENTPPMSPKKGEYTSDFLDVWKLYPYRTGHSKKEAFRCWQARLREGVSADDLRRAVINYAKERDGKDSTYTKMASTFLGPDEHWKAYLGQEERPIEQYPDPTEEYREEWERAGVNR